MTTQQYLTARKSRNWKFNCVVPEDAFRNVRSIHPLKQRCVKDIVTAARNDNMVRRLIIFGSSARYDCDPASDLDICIDWAADCYDQDGVLLPFTRSMRSAISHATRGQADVVNYSHLGDTVLTDAVEKGVVVYEHDV